MVMGNTKASESEQLKVESAGTAQNESQATVNKEQTNQTGNRQPASVFQGKGNANRETNVVDWEQKYKTLEGIHKQTDAELRRIKTERGDAAASYTVLEDIRQRLATMDAIQNDHLNLISDILVTSAGTENPEVQKRISAIKQKQAVSKSREVNRGQIAQEMLKMVKDAETQIGRQLGVNPSDDDMKPAVKAALQGNRSEALRLTNLAIIGRVSSSGKIEPSAPKSAETKPQAPKSAAPLPPPGNPGVANDWQNLPSREKIKVGLQNFRANQ